MKPLKEGDVVQTPYGIGVLQKFFYNLGTGEDCWEVVIGYSNMANGKQKMIMENVPVKDITVPKMLDILWNQDEY